MRCARLQAFLTAVLRTVICVMCPKRSLMNIKAPAWRRRAEHFYGEFSRVQRGAKAWENGDIAEFGRIMFEYGHSSIYNWETGSPELKTLYEIMLKCDGIYGGRFSGAGFNGSSVALVDPAKQDDVAAFLKEQYLAVYPQYQDDFSVRFVHTANGVEL